MCLKARSRCFWLRDFFGSTEADLPRLQQQCLIEELRRARRVVVRGQHQPTFVRQAL